MSTGNGSSAPALEYRNRKLSTAIGGWASWPEHRKRKLSIGTWAPEAQLRHLNNGTGSWALGTGTWASGPDRRVQTTAEQVYLLAKKVLQVRGLQRPKIWYVIKSIILKEISSNLHESRVFRNISRKNIFSFFPASKTWKSVSQQKSSSKQKIYLPHSRVNPDRYRLKMIA